MSFKSLHDLRMERSARQLGSSLIGSRTMSQSHGVGEARAAEPRSTIAARIEMRILDGND